MLLRITRTLSILVVLVLIQGCCDGGSEFGLLLLLLALLLDVYELASVQVEVCVQPIYLLHVDLFPFLNNIILDDHLLPWELLPDWVVASIVL